MRNEQTAKERSRRWRQHPGLKTGGLVNMLSVVKNEASAQGVEPMSSITYKDYANRSPLEQVLTDPAIVPKKAWQALHTGLEAGKALREAHAAAALGQLTFAFLEGDTHAIRSITDPVLRYIEPEDHIVLSVSE